MLPPPPPIPAERHHGIDAVRAAMMLLGVLLHVAINYVEGPAEADWPWRDPERTPLAGVLVLAIHTFRMPAFFVMSGYFAAMLIERRGLWGYAVNRFRRIAVPSVAAWFVLFPATLLSFVFVGLQSADVDDERKAALLTAAVSHPWAGAAPIHLWFMEVLILFHIVSVPLVLASRAAPRWISARVASVRHALFLGRCRWALVPVLVLVTTAAMVPMQRPGIDTPHRFLIAPSILGCYAIYFVVGWCIRREAGMVARLIQTGWWHLGLGCGALVIALITAIAWFLAVSQGAPPARWAMVLVQGSSALAAWLLVLGMLGVAERTLAHPRAIVRRLSNASFWVYLVHLPLCVLVPWSLRALPVDAVTRCALSLLIVSALLTIGYQATLTVVAPRSPT